MPTIPLGAPDRCFSPAWLALAPWTDFSACTIHFLNHFWAAFNDSSLREVVTPEKLGVLSGPSFHRPPDFRGTCATEVVPRISQGMVYIITSAVCFSDIPFKIYFSLAGISFWFCDMMIHFFGLRWVGPRQSLAIGPRPFLREGPARHPNRSGSRGIWDKMYNSTVAPKFSKYAALGFE